MTDADKPTESTGEAENLAPQTAEHALAASIMLPRVLEFTAETAYRVTSAASTRVLVVAGLNDSGKTTLVASIYEAFLRSPAFAGYCFAGSETLLGFERRCHFARLASGLPCPDTERTARGETIALLHLGVRPADLSAVRRDLLFTDISGEVFRDAKDSDGACGRLEVLRRADRLLVLIDGADLALRGRRFASYSAARDFLRRASDVGMLDDTALVDVLITKWDMVERMEAAEKEEATNYVARVEQWMRDDLASRFAEMRFATIAARPDPESPLALCYGVAALFPAWVEESMISHRPRRKIQLPPLMREIDRYAMRRGGNVGLFG